MRKFPRQDSIHGPPDNWTWMPYQWGYGTVDKGLSFFGHFICNEDTKNAPESGFFPEFRIRILPKLFSGIPESGFFSGILKSGFFRNSGSGFYRNFFPEFRNPDFFPELRNPDFFRNSGIRIFFRNFGIRIFSGIPDPDFTETFFRNPDFFPELPKSRFFPEFRNPDFSGIPESGFFRNSGIRIFPEFRNPDFFRNLLAIEVVTYMSRKKKLCTNLYTY